MIDQLSARKVVTADDRRWLVAMCAYKPTAALFEEIYLIAERGHVFVTSFPGDDTDAFNGFWSAHPLVNERALEEVPELPDPVLPPGLNTTTPTRQRRPWFAADK